VSRKNLYLSSLLASGLLLKKIIILLFTFYFLSNFYFGVEKVPLLTKSLFLGEKLKDQLTYYKKCTLWEGFSFIAYLAKKSTIKLAELEKNIYISIDLWQIQILGSYMAKCKDSLNIQASILANK
jgi:hypothetical protein